MNSHAHPSIPSLEPLEARLLLSGETSLPFTIAPRDGSVAALEGVKSSLVRGADEAGPLIDAGDYYLYEGKLSMP